MSYSISSKSVIWFVKSWSKMLFERLNLNSITLYRNQFTWFIGLFFSASVALNYWTLCRKTSVYERPLIMFYSHRQGLNKFILSPPAYIIPRHLKNLCNCLTGNATLVPTTYKRSSSKLVHLRCLQKSLLFCIAQFRLVTVFLLLLFDNIDF